MPTPDRAAASSQRRFYALTAERTPGCVGDLNRRHRANRPSRRIRRVPSVPRQDRLSAPFPCRRSLSGCRGSAHPCCRGGRSEDNQAHRSPPAALYRYRRPRAGPLSGFPSCCAATTPHPRPAGRCAVSDLWWHRQAPPRLPGPGLELRSEIPRAIRWRLQASFRDHGHACKGIAPAAAPNLRSGVWAASDGRHCHGHRQGRRSPRRASVPASSSCACKVAASPRSR